MDSVAPVLLGFVLSAALVVGAGTVLARNGDVIAARTRMGGVWIGSIFLAAATSLPELTTDISAVRMGVPDLAVGDLFGSSMANMLILGIVSLGPGADLFRRAALDNALLIAMAVLATAVAAAALLVQPEPTLLGLGPGPLVLFILYLGGTRLLYQQTTVMRAATAEVEMGAADPAATVPPRPAAPEPEGPHDGAPSLRRASLMFAGAALVILFAGPLFAHSASTLAEITGLEASFVGTWLVGFSTSLPELVTSLAAVRLGAFDLAVGNLYGSNAFNMALLLPLDVADGGGALLASVAPVHALSALVAIVMMAIGLAAVVYRARGRLSLLEPSSGLMILAYVVGLALIFAGSTG